MPRYKFNLLLDVVVEDPGSTYYNSEQAACEDATKLALEIFSTRPDLRGPSNAVQVVCDGVEIFRATIEPG
jgi:hypothetical protein